MTPSVQSGNREIAFPDREMRKPNREIAFPNREKQKPNSENAHLRKRNELQRRHPNRGTCILVASRPVERRRAIRRRSRADSFRHRSECPLELRGIDDLQFREIPAVEPTVSAEQGFRLQQRMSADKEIRDQVLPGGTFGFRTILAPQ